MNPDIYFTVEELLKAADWSATHTLFQKGLLTVDDLFPQNDLDHLLGEHREHHTLEGAIRSGMNIDPWVNRLFVFPGLAWIRHNELVAEMKVRGWPSGLNHKTLISIVPVHESYYFDLPEWPGIEKRNRHDLAARCPECAARMKGEER